MASSPRKVTVRLTQAHLVLSGLDVALSWRIRTCIQDQQGVESHVEDGCEPCEAASANEDNDLVTVRCELGRDDLGGLPPAFEAPDPESGCLVCRVNGEAGCCPPCGETCNEPSSGGGCKDWVQRPAGGPAGRAVVRRWRQLEVHLPLALHDDVALVKCGHYERSAARCRRASPGVSDTLEVISLDLARSLHDAGLAWSPENGEQFWLPERELDQTVFTVSDMVVEVRDLPAGRVLAFNGTTEWALDSVDEHEAVWLPRLDQLLDVLGTHFLSLTARSGGQVVRVQVGRRQEEHADLGATDAVARAVLSLLQSSEPM